MGSSGEASTADGASGLWGMTRLGALPAGVKKGVLAAGVLMDEAAAEEERALSLLRERFEDEGEAGTASGADDMVVSALGPPLTLALRRKARSLCSLKVLLRQNLGRMALCAAAWRGRGAVDFSGNLVWRALCATVCRRGRATGWRGCTRFR